VGKVNYITVMFKSDRPCQSVVIAGILSSHGVLVITDIASAPNPALSSPFSLRFRVDEGAHSVVIQTIRLHQVDYIESILLACSSVGYFKVVPLGVSTRIVIRL
jgi:hypothetical protein